MTSRARISEERRAIRERRVDLTNTLTRFESLVRIARASLQGLQDECPHPAAFATSHMGERCRDCPDCDACGV